MTTALPSTLPRVCDDCPWRRVSIRGWLGPYDPDEWLLLAHSDEPIACHQTIREEDSWDGARQCRGAAIYRSNVCKSPRNPAVETAPADRETVFATPTEFKEHHSR